LSNPLHPTPDGDVRGFLFELVTLEDRLSLCATHRPQVKPIFADWTAAELRRRVRAGRRELLPRAVGLHKDPTLGVLDATAGLGRDGYVLAALGASVTLVERRADLAALLRDAQRRALADLETRPGAQRINIVEADAAALMRSGQRWDVIHLDPMYPHRDKSALPQKEMQFLRELTGGDDDADALLQPALEAARRRVVVKRPTGAPFLAGRTPAFQLSGKQARYDVYLPLSHSGA
jgi:16S rRNA (guanine1516-N2)-methyltransferase